MYDLHKPKVMYAKLLIITIHAKFVQSQRPKLSI